MDSKNNRITLIAGGVVIIAVVAIAAAGFFWMKWQAQSNPEKSAKDEVASVLTAVAKLMVLPEEQPTVATVKDPEKLKDQIFFANAKTSDKVLIYSKARKAILYRPSEDKIIEVAPLNIGDNP